MPRPRLGRAKGVGVGGGETDSPSIPDAGLENELLSPRSRASRDAANRASSALLIASLINGLQLRTAGSEESSSERGALATEEQDAPVEPPPCAFWGITVWYVVAAVYGMILIPELSGYPLFFSLSPCLLLGS